MTTRRDLLKTTAGLVASGTVASSDVAAAQSDVDPHDVVPTTPEEIRAAFDDVPRLDNPTEKERRINRHYLPDMVVPEEGPIPDPVMDTPVTLTAEPWLLASAYDQAIYRSDDNRRAIEDLFLSRRQAVEEWVLPDGTNAVDALLEVVQEANGDR
jgi:hypothetical protein